MQTAGFSESLWGSKLVCVVHVHCADFLGYWERYAFGVLVLQRQASTQTSIWDARRRVGQRNSIES